MAGRVLVVCGYGCNLDSPLKPYLDRVVRFCREKKPGVVILCGGPTQQKSYPVHTEAIVMYLYLLEKLGTLEDWHPAWYTEDESFTTYDNIRDAAVIIKKRRRCEMEGEEITIFCEATRALKVALLARHFLGFPPERGEPDIRIETDSWERMHPFWELIGTIKDAMAIHLPYLNTIQRRNRMEKAKKR